MNETVSTAAQLLAQIDRSQPLPYAVLRADEHITVILYQPHDPDVQPPHEQDEYYFVAAGQARVKIGTQERGVHVGDAIFVPALTEHCFLQPSDDFACWAIFYGPKHTPQVEE